jgi:hypothetical protein
MLVGAQSVPELEMLKEFFAVTTTSIYHVRDRGKDGASAVKVALRGGSKIPVKTDIAEGGIIAICHNLQAFVPERHGRSQWRRVGKGRGGKWDFQTSGIVALFLDEAAATACLEAGNPQLCDARWLESTKAVLAAIGEKHPSFHISHDPDLDLLRPKKRRNRSRVIE